MKKIIYLSVFFICSIFNLNAQEFDFDDTDVTPSSFVVLHVDGSAEYTEKGGSSAKKVVSGMVLPEAGTLAINKKSQLKLSWKNQAVTLDKKGVYSLKNEARKLADLSMGAPAGNDFLEALGAADAFEQGTKKGSSGGETPEKINVITPIQGMVPLSSITFNWAKPTTATTFRVSVYKNADQAAIFSAMTTKNSFTIDVAQLSISEGESCFWQVENAATPSIKSEMTAITFDAKNKEAAVLKTLQSDAEYTQADPWLKLLREAHALQKADMLYAANEKYNEGLTTFSSNVVIKKMYATFLTNHGLEAIASKVFE